MVFRNPRHMRNCIYCGILFFTHTADAPLCPKCVEESREEFMQAGTLFGMELKVSESTNHLRSLYLVTNKVGEDARIHVAYIRDVLDAAKMPIKALCGNRLKRVNGIQPLVDPSSVSLYETHSDSATKWCTTCEGRFRTLIGDVRVHNFAVSMVAGHPIVIGVEMSTEEKDQSK